MAAAGRDEKELNFRILFFEMTFGMIFLIGVVFYIGAGLVMFPVLQGIEDVITYFYNLDHIALVFAFFLITYIFIFKTSTGAVSENVVKFWKYLDFRRQQPEKGPDEEIKELHINSDADRANALNAVLLFYLMQHEDNHAMRNCYQK